MHEPHCRDCESRADGHDLAILVLIANDNSVERTQSPCVEVQAPAGTKADVLQSHSLHANNSRITARELYAAGGSPLGGNLLSLRKCQEFTLDFSLGLQRKDWDVVRPLLILLNRATFLNAIHTCETPCDRSRASSSV